MRTTFLVFLPVLMGCPGHAPKVPPPVAPPSSGLTASAPGSAAGMTEDQAIRQVVANFERVHFDLDSSRLSRDAQQALSENARILQEHQGLRVEIQGHADERGTIDYNLALGARRADTVARSLGAQGIGPDRLRTISYGEERPLANGATEVAWSRNRRCEFRVLSVTDAVVGTTDG